MDRNERYDRIQLDGDDLDEIVLYGVAHLEQTAKNAWFLNLTRPDGTGYGIWLNTPGKRINAWFEERKGPPLSKWEDV